MKWAQFEAKNRRLCTEKDLEERRKKKSKNEHNNKWACDDYDKSEYKEMNACAQYFV